MRATHGLGWFLGSFIIIACGGATDLTDADDGVGGTDPGVAGSTSGGRFGFAGAPQGVAGKAVGGWNGGFAGSPAVGGCSAAPACKAGSSAFKTSEACFQTSKACYSVEVCGATLWCAPQAQCTAIPVCNPGDKQLLSSCPPNQACYTRTVCGSTIWCVNASGVAGAPGVGGSGVGGSAGAPTEGGAGGVSGAPGCDPTDGVEYNRRYVSTSPGACGLIDYVCPATTVHFVNDCGCGCEQDSLCPRVVDCMPGGSMNALCVDSSLCPFTPRAL